MKITVDTSKYQNAHGKRPAGYGMWYFNVEDNGTHNVTDDYKQALAAVRKYAKSVGAERITVLS